MTDTGKRDPYIAVLVYETIVDDGEAPSYREDVVLLWAASDEEAEQRARQRGEAEEADYENAQGQQVHMRLKHVIDITLATDTDLSQDADLYSRHFRNFDAYEHFEAMLNEDNL